MGDPAAQIRWAMDYVKQGYGSEVTVAGRREWESRQCETRRRERESRPAPDPALYECRCDHDHPPGVIWCDLCEYPVSDHG